MKPLKTCFTVACTILTLSAFGGDKLVPPKLQRAREIYDNGMKEIDAKRDGEIKKLTEQYVRILEKVKVAYTKKGDLDAALAVRKEIDGLRPLVAQKGTFLKPKKITVPDLKLTLVPIKPGSFMMGSPFDDQLQHKVTLTQPYWLGLTEVTQLQYEEIMGKNPSRFKGNNRPVETVSWDDAVAFCKKLTARERKAGRLPEGQVYRLPTEAEWEYACRAGSETAYCFGNASEKLADYAWYYENSGRTRLDEEQWNAKKLQNNKSETHDAAEKKPNAWGLYDMHGNIKEWCSDWYGDYPRGAVRDPTGPGTGSSRVSRGGSWNCPSRLCRSGHRRRYSPSYSHANLGFRLARGAL